MHTSSLWLENNIGWPSRDTVKRGTMWNTSKGVQMAEPPRSEENTHELSWTFRQKCLCSWMKFCNLTLSNSTFFFLKTQLRNKAELIYTTKQNQKAVSVLPSHYWLLTTQVFLLQTLKDPLKRKEFVSWKLVQPAVPLPPGMTRRKGE